VATGKVIGRGYPRHRSREFLKFLRAVDAGVPRDLDGHLVMDNYATPKTPAIRAWLARRPHWHVHLTPTSASWRNQIERFFAELTNQPIRRGVHRSLRQLERDPPLHRPGQRPPQALPLDPLGRRHPRQHPTLLRQNPRCCRQPTQHNGNNFRIGTLVLAIIDQ
jgi:hypothetical protein